MLLERRVAVSFNNVPNVTHPERVTIGTRESIAVDVAERLAELAQRAFAARGLFTIAIAGGSVADVCLPVLANAALPWGVTHIFWVDERAVPLTDPESNAGKAMAMWHGSRLAEGATLHPIIADPSDLERSAADYSAEIASVLGTPAVFDAVLLGVGEDGHIASLFPDHPELERTDVDVLAITDSPKPPAQRLTVSMGVLTRARNVFVVAFGAGKARVMREALRDADSQLPVTLATRANAKSLVFLDAAAASAL